MLRLRHDKLRSRRVGFSLAELVISVGILLLMLGLAGQVFSITIKSTGQATALTEVTQLLRVFEETLREDLRHVQPNQSVMLIQGNPVNAYWSQAGKEADDDNDPSNGYGHPLDLERQKLKDDGTPETDSNRNPILSMPRADLLMFFTARKATSQINPNVSSRMQQVTYGHANMGEYDDPANPIELTSQFSAQDLLQASAELGLLPAQQWHLARRSVLVLGVPAQASLPVASLPRSLSDSMLQDGAADVLWNTDFGRQVLRCQVDNTGAPIGEPWYLPEAIAGRNSTGLMVRSQLDATPPMMMANRTGAYFMPNCASFKVEWSLDPHSSFVAGRLNGIAETFWFDHGVDSTIRNPDPLLALQKKIDELEDKSDPVSATQRANLISLLCDQTPHPDGSFYSLSDRFRGRPCDGNQYDPDLRWEQLSADGVTPSIASFTASRPTGKCNQSAYTCLSDSDCPSGQLCLPGVAEDDIWPGALRITVDVFDREGRLERPIRHVMVLPVGG